MLVPFCIGCLDKWMQKNGPTNKVRQYDIGSGLSIGQLSVLWCFFIIISSLNLYTIFHKDKGQLLVKYNYIYMYWSLLTTPQMAIWSSTYLSSLKYLKHAGTDLHVGQIIQRKWETRQEAYLAWYKRVA